jgi:hypothetical protein
MMKSTFQALVLSSVCALEAETETRVETEVNDAA